jgi:hypothetical protein
MSSKNKKAQETTRSPPLVLRIFPNIRGNKSLRWLVHRHQEFESFHPAHFLFQSLFQYHPNADTIQNKKAGVIQQNKESTRMIGVIQCHPKTIRPKKQPEARRASFESLLVGTRQQVSSVEPFFCLPRNKTGVEIGNHREWDTRCQACAEIRQRVKYVPKQVSPNASFRHHNRGTRVKTEPPPITSMRHKSQVIMSTPPFSQYIDRYIDRFD